MPTIARHDNDIESRVVALRRLTSLSLTLSGVASIIALMTMLHRGATSLDTEELVLRDAIGTKRAQLKVQDDGFVRLSLLDKNRERLVLTVGADGSPSILLVDPDSNVRAGFGLIADRDPAVTLFDTHGRNMVRMGVESGSASLVLNASPRLAALRLETTPVGFIGTSIQGRGEEIRARFGMYQDGQLGVQLFDDTGLNRVRIGLGHDGSPTVTLYDTHGSPSAGFDVLTDGQAISFPHKAMAILADQQPPKRPTKRQP